MHGLSEKLSFTLSQDLSDGEVPGLVQVLPAGDVRPKGKTDFTVDEEARKAVVEAFAKSSTDLVIDYEHQSLSGSEAPAAGWIKGLEDRGEEGVWAKVQWTARAKEYLRKREYRYLSPVVLIRKKDGRAVELLGAALTNLPAIDGMEPVVNTGRPAPVPGADEAGRFKEMYLGVLKLVGLPEGAGLPEVKARVDSMLSPQGFVPEGEYAALKAALREKEADALVKEALASGRVAPSLAGWAREYAVRDAEGFREFLGKSVPVVPLGGREYAPAEAVDAAQREVNRLLGLGDETFIRCMQSVS